VDGALGPADARAAHDRAQRGLLAGGEGHGRRDRCLVGHVGLDELPAYLLGDLLTQLLVQVGDDNGAPRCGELARSRLTESARATGDDRCCSAQFHGREHTGLAASRGGRPGGSSRRRCYPSPLSVPPSTMRTGRRPTTACYLVVAPSRYILKWARRLASL